MLCATPTIPAEAIYAIRLQGSVYDGFYPFDRLGELVLTPTVTGVTTNELNPREVVFYSGDPGANPQAGAVRFATNRALYRLFGDVNNISHLDFAYVNLDEANGRITIQPDYNIAAAAQFNHFTAVSSPGASLFTIAKGTINLDFKDGGKTLTGVVDVKGRLNLGIDDPFFDVPYYATVTGVRQAPDVGVSITDGGVTATPGGTIAYTLDYSNSGNQNATGVALEVILPAHTRFNAAASTAGWLDQGNGRFRLPVGTLVAGASGRATFAVAVDAQVPPGVSEFRAEVTIVRETVWGADSNSCDNTASDVTPFQAPGAPDLLPFQPEGWDAKLVVSKQPGTHTSATTFTTADTLYIDWAAINGGNAPVSGQFHSELWIDGQRVETWVSNPPVSSGSYVSVSDFPWGPLAAGEHTLTLKVDAHGQVAESNEANNDFTRTITVQALGAPDLLPFQPEGWDAKLVVSTQAGTHTSATTFTTADTLYIDWAAINSGNAPVTGAFYTELWIDGQLVQDWISNPPVNPGANVSIEDFTRSPLAAGEHTLTLKVDARGQVAESNEANNTFTRTITVLPPAAPDLKADKPAGWDAELVVSTRTGTNATATTITTADTVYIDWAVLNAGNAAVGVSYRTELLLNGQSKQTWTVNPPHDPNVFKTLLDYNLGSLPAGEHTLTFKIDTLGAVAESNEGNNTVTRTIFVEAPSLPDLRPYRPSGWDAELVISTQTGTHADAATITTADTLYIDWAALNAGNAATAVPFVVELLVNGQSAKTWTVSPPLDPNYYIPWEDHNLGSLPAGNHTLTLKIDALGAIAESNEANNTVTRPIAVNAAPPSGALSVTVAPGTVSEAAGANAAMGAVTRTGSLQSALIVTLTSSDASEATVPATVVIPAGQASANFAINAVDDNVLDGTQSVTIAASAQGYAAGAAPLQVTDREESITLQGTTGNDSFTFTVGAPYVIELNGKRFEFEAAAPVVAFNGREGNDKVVWRAGAGKDSAVLRPGVASLTGPNYRASASNVEDVRVYSGGGDDEQIKLYDTTGDDTYYGKPAASWLTGANGYFFYAAGFDRVYAYATAGGNDRANLYDTPDDDTYYGKPAASWLTSANGYYNYAAGFDRVYAYATAGGNDRANLYDTPDDDTYYGKPAASWLTSANGYYNYAAGFDRVYAYATAGGNDRANLYDTSGDDTYYGKPTASWFAGANGYYNYATGFARVYAYATAGGNDRANLYDTPGDDLFYGRATYARLTGPGYFNYADKFARVVAYKQQAGADRLNVSAIDYLFSSVGNWL